MQQYPTPTESHPEAGLSPRPRTPHRYRRRRRPPLPVLLCFSAAAVLAVVLCCVLFLHHGGGKSRQSENIPLTPSAQSRIEVIEQYAVFNSCYLSNQKIRVEGLMLHSVGTPQPSAEVFAKQFNTFQPNGREVCPHAFLQADGTVYQILPWNHYGWHAGGSTNRTHIGIEMCEPDTIVYTGPTTFDVLDTSAARTYTEETYRSAVHLFAELCLAYDLDPLEEGVIVSHGEAGAQGTASDHTDPEHLWQGLDLPYTMESFRADVAEHLKRLQK